jgi:hypothetical protein
VGLWLDLLILEDASDMAQHLQYEGEQHHQLEEDGTEISEKDHRGFEDCREVDQE